MNRISILTGLLIALIAMPVFAEEVLGPTGGGSTIDLEPPVISHDPISGALKAQQALELQIRITDDHGVFSATLFYRNEGAKEFRSLAMRLSESQNDVYVIEIPAQDINPPKLEYYIQATDVSGNTVLRGGRLFPLSVAVESDFVPLAATTTASTISTTTEESSKGLTLTNGSEKKYLWAWIAGGAVLGALIAASGKSDGDSPSTSPKTNSSLEIVFPNPTPPPQ